jgi:hypothetical protein
MTSTPFCRALVLLLVSGFCAPLAFGQGEGGALGKTTLGKSQNTSQDLANSLVPGPPRYGKNEKKTEVDPKTLQSKKTNDTTFSGSLNDIGLDWGGNKLGKPHGSSSETEAKDAKQSDADAKKESKPTKTTDASAESKGGEQKVTASKSDEKSADKQPDKQKNSDSAGDR